MNPLELQKALAPVLGDEVARALAAVAAQHKKGAAFKATMPSGVLVTIAENLVELRGAAQAAKYIKDLERRLAYYESRDNFGNDVYDLLDESQDEDDEDER